MMKKEQLKEKFANYQGSDYFIECCYEALDMRKENRITWFVSNHFIQNKTCDYEIVRKLAAHWNNVAFTKLNLLDFNNYIQSLTTCANYRMVGKIMEEREEVLDGNR